MKKGKIALMGLLLIGFSSCKKAAKIEQEDQEIRQKVTVSTFSGGIIGYQDGLASYAKYNHPTSMAVDASGNLFIADFGNYCIRKISSAGIVSTFAGRAGAQGYADGAGTAALFDTPYGLVIDTDNNLYVTDLRNNCIRKITPAGVVSTFAGTAGDGDFADGTGAAARFNLGDRYANSGMCIDASNNLYVADNKNNLIRKITPAGVVTTIAGNGIPARYNQPGVDGPAATADLGGPVDLAIDASGSIYFNSNTSASYNCVRKLANGIVSTIAGDLLDRNAAFHWQDGNAGGATFCQLRGLAVDGAGNVYVADALNQVIRKITPAGFVSTIGVPYNFITAQDPGGIFRHIDGDASVAAFASPINLAFDKEYKNLYVSQYFSNTKGGNYIRKINFSPMPTILSKEEQDLQNWNKPIGWK